MKTFTVTKHAAKRQQQRNVSQQSLELLQEFGRKIYDHRGGYSLIFDKASQAAVRARFGKTVAQLRLDVFAVFDAKGNRLITTGHLTRRIKEAA